MIPIIAIIIQGGAFIFQVVSLFLNKKETGKITALILMASGIFLFIYFIQRSLAISFPAITNTFESLLFFSMATVLILGIYNLKSAVKLPGVITLLGTFISIALLACASSPLAPPEIQAPIPALQSNWLVLHVAFSFIGEAFFVVSFSAAVYYLITTDDGMKKKLDRIIYLAIVVGYPIFTAGALIFGAIWAQNAWGRFWGWDPKETWALITWLTYTLYLHNRLVKKRSGASSAWLSIIGFGFTVFTFLGVNFLLPGLHSYG